MSNDASPSEQSADSGHDRTGSTPIDSSEEPKPEVAASESDSTESESVTLPGPSPQRWVLAFFQAGRGNDPFGAMNGYVFNRVRRLLERQPIAEGSQVDVWLDSPGGSATVAYKLILELRHYFEFVRMVVPSYAKSAATLLTIGGDEIVMGHSAELGPLDVQLEHPDREGVRISGIDASRALGFVADFAVDYLIIGGSSVFASTDLPRLDVLREFSSFTAKFLEPLVSKLDPQLIHRAAQDLELATHYAVEVMRRRANWTGSDQDLVGLAEHLVTDYPAHEYLISRSEATALELPVTCLEEYDKKEQAAVLYRAYAAGKFATDSTNHLFQLWQSDELDDKMVELVSPPQTEEECDEDDSHDEQEKEDDE